MAAARTSVVSHLICLACTKAELESPALGHLRRRLLLGPLGRISDGANHIPVHIGLPCTVVDGAEQNPLRVGKV